MNYRILLARLLRWFTTPQSAIDPLNFRNVQIDAVGVGLASAAAPFLPVFLARLGADTLQVSLLTTMPAVTGLLLSIPLGQFLQSRKNIIPWFSMARLTVLLGYTFTGIITLFLPAQTGIFSILGIWAIATIPQTILSITFSVVMNSVAGPAGRYELMSHRWIILGITTFITTLFIGQMLDRVIFPFNFQLAFILLSLGGVISFFFSNRIHLKSIMKIENNRGKPINALLHDYVHLIYKEKPFVNFIAQRFIFLFGTTIATTLIPLYFVRVLNASNLWIANISLVQTLLLVLGYVVWTRQSRKHGSRLVLLATTFGISLYPILTGVTSSVWIILIYAGFSGIFQAGLNLVLFDELMRRVPEEYSATFIAAAQSLQYLSSIFAPLVATWVSGLFGFTIALILGGVVSLGGFVLFLLDNHKAEAVVQNSQA